MYDIIIVGGGPAGMTAALYAARDGKSVLIIERETFGGQITYSPKVENFPGMPSVSGNEFAEKLLDQVLAQGVDIEIDTVTQVEDNTSASGNYKVVSTESKGHSAYESRTVILANGVKHRLMGLPHEEELIGQGIHFCAVCDGDFYKDKVVCVIGGGNSAFQEAILLADKCQEVIMIQDLDHFTSEKKLQENFLHRDNVRYFTNTKIDNLMVKDEQLVGIKLENKSSGLHNEIFCDGIFVAIGLMPNNDRFLNVAGVNSKGYFVSTEDCCTHTPGVFVAGDCRTKNIRQLTTAVADGAVAAISACRYISTTF